MGNIYQKLADAREEFHSLKLKKTGKNNYAGYTYFELGDFLIPAMQCLKKHGLLPIVSFAGDVAVMNVHELDGDGVITITSPMAEANLKGCHPIQNLGAVETYNRRYLWVALMEIVEHDALDSAPPVDEKPKPKAVVRNINQKPKNNARPVEQKEVLPDFYCEDEEAAEEYANFMITTAREMHSGSMGTLVEFWKRNLNASNYLKENYPDQYQSLIDEFGKLKADLQGV